MILIDVTVIDIHRCCSDHWLLCELPIKLWVWTCYWIFLWDSKGGVLCVFLWISVVYLHVMSLFGINWQFVCRPLSGLLEVIGWAWLFSHCPVKQWWQLVLCTDHWLMGKSIQPKKKELTQNDHLFIHTDIYTQ